jgi:hypothetical protein
VRREICCERQDEFQAGTDAVEDQQRWLAGSADRTRDAYAVCAGVAHFDCRRDIGRGHPITSA